MLGLGLSGIDFMMETRWLVWPSILLLGVYALVAFKYGFMSLEIRPSGLFEVGFT
jgi:hypothetical protein